MNVLSMGPLSNGRARRWLAFVVTLFLFQTARGAVVGADALVLVNSTSPKFSDFRQHIQPYLSNFGVPYVVLDIASNVVGTNIGLHSLIIIGHAQLDTNHVYLDSVAQSNLSLVVSNGTGLVNFDSTLSLGSNAPIYQYVQDIFGFGYGATGTSGTNVTFPATEAGATMHYVTARHQPTNAVTLTTNMNMANLIVPTNATTVALSSGHPLLVVSKYGQGRAVQWAGYDWMNVAVKGPIDGLDDLLWRGFVWSARKPFVMRGLPNFAILRVDDAENDFTWAQQAAAVGFRPWIGVFLDNMTNSATKTAHLKTLVTNGLATTSVHSIASSLLMYWDHNAKTNLSDSVVAANFAAATAWHTNNGIPISKVVIAHWGEFGTNCFAGLLNWGVEYFPIEIIPNTLEYYPPYAPWLMAGPYRYFEPPGQGQSANPYFYADFLTVPNHPEMAGKFFNCLTVIGDDAPCNEWCPDNDVPGSVGRGVRQLKRAWDSMALGTLYTHDNLYVSLISSANWVSILSGVTNGIASDNPQYVTLDYGCQYVRATRTSTLTNSTYDTITGRLTAYFKGYTDLNTVAYVYNGQDTNITATTSAVPVFTNGTNVTLAMLLPPLLGVSISSNNNVTISWPNPAPGYVLQENELVGSTNWVTVTNQAVLAGDQWQVTMPVSTTNCFYRLIKP